mmetsp:Transcript_22699/g.30022  ORF Transcript_22699/g.30022 Transcript_22699/m.30022 type:complete len:392 (+) Transcript_22699:348-1523(+)
MSTRDHTEQNSSNGNSRRSTRTARSPHSGSTAAPVDGSGSPHQSPQHRAIIPFPHSSHPHLHNPSISRRLLAPLQHRPHMRGFSLPSHHSQHHSSLSSSPTSSRRIFHPQGGTTATMPNSPITDRRFAERARSRSRDAESMGGSPPISPVARSLTSSRTSAGSSTPRSNSDKKKTADNSAAIRARAKSAQIENDSMVYLDGPQVYTCGQCRTHLTSHDDIISKSFHGRHGRAYLFDQCVNVTVGPAEDRLLITGLHSVCDIFCKRCKGMVGWTYAKAYESSQKYKEGKFIIEKINLHLEESDYYDVSHPAGERTDRWRKRSMSWGSEKSITSSPGSGKDMVYEYNPNSPFSTLSPRQRARSISTGGYAIGSPSVAPKTNKLSRNLPEPPLL